MCKSICKQTHNAKHDRSMIVSPISSPNSRGLLFLFSGDTGDLQSPNRSPASTHSRSRHIMWSRHTPRVPGTSEVHIHTHPPRVHTDTHLCSRFWRPAGTRILAGNWTTRVAILAWLALTVDWREFCTPRRASRRRRAGPACSSRPAHTAGRWMAGAGGEDRRGKRRRQENKRQQQQQHGQQERI